MWSVSGKEPDTKSVVQVWHRFICWWSVFQSWFLALLRADDHFITRWAHIHEVTSILHHSVDGLIFGLSEFGHIFRINHRHAKRKANNLLVVAPTGRGKSMLVTNQIFRWKHHIVVNDIKLELDELTANYRQHMTPHAKVFRLTTDGKGNKFDPLHDLKSEKDFTIAATNLLGIHPTKEPIFTQRAIVMLTQIFLASRIEGIPPFKYLYEMIHSGMDGCIDKLQKVSPDLATQFLDMSYKAYKTRHDDQFMSSCFGTFSNPMRLLLTDEIVDSLSGSDFTPEEIITSEDPVTLYICYPQYELFALAPLIRLVYASLFNGMMKAYRDRKGVGCRPVFFPIDEGGVTPIPGMKDFAALTNGFNIFIGMYIQDITQLHSLYGYADAETIMSNMETQLYYRQNSIATAEYLKRKYDNSKMWEMSIRAMQELEDHEVLGFHGSLKPFKLRRLDWTHYPRHD